MTPITTAALTDVGKSRERNEDSFFQNGNDIFGVLDGVGGGAGGQVASQSCAKFLTKKSDDLRGQKDQKEVLKSLLHDADSLLLEKTTGSPELKGMGTTATLVSVVESQEQGLKAHIVILGDSRVYLYRNGALIQLGIDQSWINVQIRNGFYPTKKEKEEYGSAISACLGSGQSEISDYYSFQVQEGDLLIACSDGLYGEVPHSDMRKVIVKVLKKEFPPQQFVERLNKELIKAANDEGGGDNITVITSVIGDTVPVHEPGKGDIYKNVNWILGHHSGSLQSFPSLNAIKEKHIFFTEQSFLVGSHGFVNYFHDEEGIKESLQLAGVEPDETWQSIIDSLKDKVEEYKKKLPSPKMEAEAVISVATNLRQPQPKKGQRMTLFVLSAIAILLLCIIGLKLIPDPMDDEGIEFEGITHYTPQDYLRRVETQGQALSLSESHKAFFYIAHSFLDGYRGNKPSAIDADKLSNELKDHYTLTVNINALSTLVKNKASLSGKKKELEKIIEELKELESSQYVGQLAKVNLVLVEAAYNQKTGKYLFKPEEILKRTESILNQGAAKEPYSFLWAFYSHHKSGGKLSPSQRKAVSHIVTTFPGSPLGFFTALSTQSFSQAQDIWKGLNFDIKSIQHFQAPYGLYPAIDLKTFFPRNQLQVQISKYIKVKRNASLLLCYTDLILGITTTSCPSLDDILDSFVNIQNRISTSMVTVEAFYQFKQAFNLNAKAAIAEQTKILSHSNAPLSYKAYIELSHLRDLEGTGTEVRLFKQEVLKSIKKFPWFSPLYTTFLKTSTASIKL